MMKRTTILSAAGQLLALIVMFLGLRIWASDAAVSVTGPSAIHGKRAVPAIIINSVYQPDVDVYENRGH